jgi:uncharacterized protein (TIGR00369 family)
VPQGPEPRTRHRGNQEDAGRAPDLITARTISTRPTFVSEPDPDNPGWVRWNLSDTTRYNGTTLGDLILRQEGDKVRLRLVPHHRHTNLLDSIHGGVILGLADVSLFATARTLLGEHLAGGVTLDLSCQFIGAGRLGAPLDAVGEVLRETGRIVFMRGLIEQEGATIAAFNAGLRKPSRRV